MLISWFIRCRYSGVWSVFVMFSLAYFGTRSQILFPTKRYYEGLAAKYFSHKNSIYSTFISGWSVIFSASDNCHCLPQCTCTTSPVRIFHLLQIYNTNFIHYAFSFLRLGFNTSPGKESIQEYMDNVGAMACADMVENLSSRMDYSTLSRYTIQTSSIMHVGCFIK
jgi:hypothetical protein